MIPAPGHGQEWSRVAPDPSWDAQRLLEVLAPGWPLMAGFLQI